MLISYSDSTTHYRLVGIINDQPQDLHLALYADADIAGGAKFTSALAHSLCQEGALA